MVTTHSDGSQISNTIHEWNSELERRELSNGELGRNVTLQPECDTTIKAP